MYSKFLFRTIFIAAALLVATLFLIDGPVRAQASATIDQCANGDANADPTCTSSGSTGWINGNVNGNKASYTLGDYVAYRQTLADLTVGYTYCFGFGWDTNINGKPAIDYIGTFNSTISQADPTHGYTQFSVGIPSETVAIPGDPVLTATMAGKSFTSTQPSGVITTWGTNAFTINGYSNDGSADLDSNGTYQQSLEYCFEAADAEVIIAWGGHIARPAEWGGLTRPTGSPYHASNGTRQGMATAPRSGETDLVCIPNDGGEVAHNNEGREETQLQISDPGVTAISLAGTLGASETTNSMGPIAAIAAVGGLMVATLLLWKRQESR